MIATAGVQCPRCHRSETNALAREGDLQRYQCASCSENFTAPYVADPKMEPAPGVPEEPRSPSTAHATIAPPDPIDEPVQRDGAAGHCPKCRKPYLRLGKHYESHVAACDGTPWVEREPRGTRVQAVQPPAQMPPGAEKAIDLSIEALKAQRSVLEGEIRGINGAIETLEKLKGGSSRPLAAGA